VEESWSGDSWKIFLRMIPLEPSSCCCVDGTIVAVEALARWSHTGRGDVSPCEFIPLAEEAGLIKLLAIQIIEMAAGQVAKWRGGLAPTLQLSVNTRLVN